MLSSQTLDQRHLLVGTGLPEIHLYDVHQPSQANPRIVGYVVVERNQVARLA